MKTIFKKFYKLIPFKKQLFVVLKKFWTPSHSIYKHLHFTGIITINIDASHSFKINHYGFEVENEIFWRGLDGWEKYSIELWIKLCKNANVIIDIGANTGIFSLIARSINPAAKVYAFEPVNRVFDKLKENIFLNNYDITCIEKAVSDKDGSATIYDTNEEHIYSVTVNKNIMAEGKNVTETTIQTIALDNFIRQTGLTNIDLIKIDVETHEPEVLDGFKEYLIAYQPTMLIEVLSDEIGMQIQEKVSGLNYLYFNIDENKGIRKVDTITKSDYYNYLLCKASVAKSLGLQID